MAQAEDELKFRGLEEGEKLNQSLISKRFVPTDQWRQEVQLITYEAKKKKKRMRFARSVSGLDTGKQGGIHLSSQSHMEKDGNLQ